MRILCIFACLIFTIACSHNPTRSVATEETTTVGSRLGASSHGAEDSKTCPSALNEKGYFPNDFKQFTCRMKVETKSGKKFSVRKSTVAENRCDATKEVALFIANGGTVQSQGGEVIKRRQGRFYLAEHINGRWQPTNDQVISYEPVVCRDY